MRRLILIPFLVVIGVLAIAGGVGYWIYNNYNYYGTDDAQVSGQIVTVSSPQTGQLTNFAEQLGNKVTANQPLGTITVVSPTGIKSTVDVSSPINGTVIQVSVVQGQGVAPGIPLVEVADLNSLTVTAYVDESAISNIKLGQNVDVKIDAFSGTTYTGHVSQIVQAAASTFSILPTSDNASGNYTKVSQRIPVVITLDSVGANDVVPNMSASVTIHLH